MLALWYGDVNLWGSFETNNIFYNPIIHKSTKS